jgi:HK97 family phage portal protein
VEHRVNSIFKRIFKKAKPPSGHIDRAEVLGGGVNVFSAWSGDAYSNDVSRAAIDAIARNAAKLKGSHVIRYSEKERVDGEARLNRILQIEPNPYMSAFDLLYKLITHYYLYNNSFAYLLKNVRRQLVAIYPLCPVQVEYLSNGGGSLYCRFRFNAGNEVILPYEDIVHFRRNYNSNDLFGDQNTALMPALQLAHMQNEGIINAIKSGAAIRGILKRSQLANVELLKEMRDNFIKDYLDISNNGGIAVLDNASEYIPIENKAYSIDEGQMKAAKTKIYDYLGVSEAIVNSSYTEEQWAAFYESTIEPLALQFSLELTRKVFNERERAFGNAIMFESGRLQFSSTATKTNIIKELLPFGVFTLNEAREIFNLPTVEDGDQRFQTLNIIAAELAKNYQLSQTAADLTEVLMMSEGKDERNKD